MSKSEWVGIDVFVKCIAIPELASLKGAFTLLSIANRGTLVWPGNKPEFELCDIFQCRFMRSPGAQLSTADVSQLLEILDKQKLEWVHTEKLFEYAGKAGFSNPAKA